MRKILSINKEYKRIIGEVVKVSKNLIYLRDIKIYDLDSCNNIKLHSESVKLLNLNDTGYLLLLRQIEKDTYKAINLGTLDFKKKKIEDAIFNKCYINLNNEELSEIKKALIKE